MEREGDGCRWEEHSWCPGRAVCVHVWVIHKEPQAAALNRKSHLPHSKFKYCWSIPTCLSKALSLWDLIPGSLLERSAELVPSVSRGLGFAGASKVALAMAPALVLPGEPRNCSGYCDQCWACLQRRGSVVGWVYHLEPISLKVLGSPNHAVDIVVVSATWVCLIDLEVAHSCMVGADSPWKELRSSCYGLVSKK